MNISYNAQRNPHLGAPGVTNMQKVIGHAFPSNLNGYEDVYSELEEAIA